MSQLVANSRGQNLFEHSYMIAHIAVHIYEKFFLHWKNNQLLCWEDYFEHLNISPESQKFNCKNSLDKLPSAIFLSGLLHDIGKIDKNFQDYLKSQNDKTEHDGNGVHIDDKTFSFDVYPRHNEISWIFVNLLNGNAGKNVLKSEMKDLISYAVFWHHAKPMRSKPDDFKTSQQIYEKFKNKQDLSYFIQYLSDYFSYVHDKKTEFVKYGLENIEQYLQVDIDDLNHLSKESSIPTFKSISENYVLDTLKTIVRMCVILADRYVSSLSEEDLSQKIQFKEFYLSADELNELMIQDEERLSLMKNLEGMLDHFNKLAQSNGSNELRNNKQNQAADALNKSDIMILKGAAGSGKTKVMLTYALKRLENNKKQNIFIIAPKNIICKGLYDELKNEYLKHSTIELFTGEFKKRFTNGQEDEIEESNLDADVIITTIDQILAILMSHKKTDILFKILNSIVIFDEFHEFVDTPGILYLFREILLMKSFMAQSNTLLVSATPNPYFVHHFLELPTSNIVNLETFNDKDYSFEFTAVDDTSYQKMDFNKNPMMKSNSEDDLGHIYIFNSATKSQFATLLNYNNDLNIINYHSKFTPNDKQIIFKTIMDGFSKHNQFGGPFNKHSIIKSGPIIQASINITTTKMYTEICSAEFWCQRLGRLNRFGEDITAVLNTIYPLDKETKNVGINKVLLSFNQYNIAYAWLDFIKNKLTSQPIQLKKIYELYDEFHKTHEAKNAYKSEFDKIKKTAENVFKQDFEPIEFKDGGKGGKNKKLSSKSLRSDSYYILPAIMNIDHQFNFSLKKSNGKIEFTENIHHFTEDKKTKTYPVNPSLILSVERKILTTGIGTYTGMIKKYENIAHHISYTKNNNFGNKLKNLSDKDFYHLAKQKHTPIVVSGLSEKQPYEDHELFYIESPKNHVEHSTQMTKIGLFKYAYLALLSTKINPTAANISVNLAEDHEDDSE